MAKGMKVFVDRLEKENASLRAEIKRINGPFTCKHDPKFTGGACAACHALALDALGKCVAALKEIAQAKGLVASHGDALDAGLLCLVPHKSSDKDSVHE